MRLSTPYFKVRDATCVVVVLAASIVALAGVPAGGAAQPKRLDDLRWLGTHNSYHLRPDRELLPNEPADYAHPPLTVQLDLGVRSLELDTWNGPGFPVFHSLVIDTGSTCPTLDECFRTIARWSKAHPKHQALVLFVEAKPIPVIPNATAEEVIGNATRDQGITNWDAAAFDRVDALVRKSFGKTLITPDDVRGKRRTLRDAVTHDGWPTAAKSRGKVLVNLIGDQAERDVYLAASPLLKGRAMFVNAKPTEPSAAIISRDVPDAAAHIPELVRQHFIVKTRADVDGIQARANDHTRADAALASGAQIIVTDYAVADPKVGPYVVTVPDAGR